MGVTVIGGGAAATMAALAARARGADVEIRGRAWGATALSSGAVDLAGDPAEMPGDPWAGRPSVERNLAEMIRHNPRHPIRLVRAHVAAALEAFCGWISLAGVRPLTAPNLVLPTDLGTWKSTFLAQPSQVPGHLPALAGKSGVVVGVRGWPLFRSRFIAASLQDLARGGGIDLELVSEAAVWPCDVAFREPHELARALDADGGAERLGEALRPLVRGRDFALLPPVLGLSRGDVSDRASATAGVPVLEPLASELSVPGLRLQVALARALDESGVRRAASPGCPEGPTVLATGRFLGGGIVCRSEGFFDAVFDLSAPVLGRGSPFGTDVAGPHPALGAGVLTDDLLRPDPGRPDLFAAGAVLGGYDPVRERCGLGTAVVTGWAAGTFAAESA